MIVVCVLLPPFDVVGNKFNDCGWYVGVVYFVDEFV